MRLDDLDLEILRENFDDETISKIDINNVYKIFKYLEENDIYYAKDLFISSLDLFLMPLEEFIFHFEKLKNKLGENYAFKLGEDSSLIEFMYED